MTMRELEKGTELPALLPIWDKMDPRDRDEMERAAAERRVPAGTMVHSGEEHCLGLLIIRLSGGVAVLVCIGAFLFGLGFSLLNMAPPLLVKQVVGEKEYGRIYSYIASLLTLASASAAFIYGKIYDLHQSYDWALVFAIVSLTVSVLISLYIQRRTKGLWTGAAEAKEEK